MIIQEKMTKAILKKIRVSPQKLNLVAQMIRGMTTTHAVDVLLYSKKRIAKEVRKTLLSAVANAENNHNFDVASLYVKEAYVGYSLKLKRFRPKGRGKSEVVTKPFSNLTIIVAQKVGV